MLIFGNKNPYFYLLKSIYKYSGLIKKQVFFAQNSLSGIKFSGKNLHGLGGSKHVKFDLIREIVNSLIEVQWKSYERVSLWGKKNIEFVAVTEELFQL